MSFTVQFAPAGAGSKQAEVIISSNDPEEGSFSFFIIGIGLVLEAEISVEKDSVEILSGGSYDFGNVEVNSSTYEPFYITICANNSGNKNS